MNGLDFSMRRMGRGEVRTGKRGTCVWYSEACGPIIRTGQQETQLASGEARGIPIPPYYYFCCNPEPGTPGKHAAPTQDTTKHCISCDKMVPRSQYKYPPTTPSAATQNPGLPASMQRLRKTQQNTVFLAIKWYPARNTNTPLLHLLLQLNLKSYLEVRLNAMEHARNKSFFVLLVKSQLFFSHQSQEKCCGCLKVRWL